MPRDRKYFAQANPAAPAPENTTRSVWSGLPTSSAAFSRAAPATMAVPCWSSWKTGMSRRRWHSFSMAKHSGARMSSRLMPPKVGARAQTMSTNRSGFVSSTSMSKASRSAKRLNSTAFPSITGLLARAPMGPRPSTAVPFVITPTRWPRVV